MKLSVNDKNIINLRDLEFENKVWKNRLEYLIHEIQIHRHHIESYCLELKDSLIDELLQQSLNELEENYHIAISLEKKVQIQEEEIPHYIKDFPISAFHEFYKEHHNIEQEINEFYKKSAESIRRIRISLKGIFKI